MSSGNGFPQVDQQLNHFFATTSCRPGVQGFVNPDGVCVQKGFTDSAPFAAVGPTGTCQIERQDLDARGFMTDVAILSVGARKDWSTGTAPAPTRPDHFCPAEGRQIRVPGVDCYYRA